MPRIYGGTANSSSGGGWRAVVDYSTSEESQRVVVSVPLVFPGAVNSSYYLIGIDSQSGTLKINGSTVSNQILLINDGSGDTGNENWGWRYSVREYQKDVNLNKGHAARTERVPVSASIVSFALANSRHQQVTSAFSGTSTAYISVEVPALESWTVTLTDGAETSTLVKYYGEALALPQPVKTGYKFAGWADEDAPSTVVYQPGAPYTANAAASLVAVYSPVISSAVITQLYAARDDGSFTWDSQTGTHTSASDDGEYVYIRAWWRVEGADAATISLDASMADTSTVWTGATRQVSKPGTGELYIEGVAEWGTTQTALVTGQYDVTVTLSTGAGNPSDTRGTTVSTAFFTIDVLAGGHGIAFGKPATQQLLDVGMETNFDHDVRVMGTPLVPVGTILDFAAATAPSGYLVCDGSAVSRSTYAALFAVIGTTWGTGDGSTTFNLPDLSGRTTIGTGTASGGSYARSLGDTGGAETHHHNGGSHTLTTAQIPAHYHLPSADTDFKFAGFKPLSGTAGQFDLQARSSGSHRYALASSESGRTTYWSNTQNAGGGGAHSHGATTDTSSMQPFATVTKIIRAI